MTAGEAHVWLARIDEAQRDKTTAATELLSEDELARAARFRFGRDKTRFIHARAVLRVLLGRYLNKNPRSLRFSYNQSGKPSLSDANSSALNFNLSHSGDWAIFAFTDDCAVGVDLEFIKPDFVEDPVIAQTLTDFETRRYRTLEQKRRDEFFFDCWTRKEAYLKAVGDGFLTAPNLIETVKYAPFAVEINTRAERARSFFRFYKLPAIAGCRAALALDRDEAQPEFWRFDD